MAGAIPAACFSLGSFTSQKDLFQGDRKMFINTQGKGFQMSFPNGYRISVQWGRNNYCENQFMDRDHKIKYNSRLESVDAEIAILDDDDNFHRPPSWAEDVKGWCNTSDVLDWMNYTSNLPKKGE